MTTFTHPIRMRMPDSYMSFPLQAGYNNENFLGQGGATTGNLGMGYNPVMYPVYLTNASFPIAAGTPAVTRSFVIPAGAILHSVVVDIKESFAGVSLATPTFNVGLGNSNVNLMTNVDASTKSRKTFGTNGVPAGVSLLGTVLTADTTINITVSVSGTAAQSIGPLNGGQMTFYVELG